jgi:hypothetical protein
LLPIVESFDACCSRKEGDMLKEEGDSFMILFRRTPA